MSEVTGNRPTISAVKAMSTEPASPFMPIPPMYRMLALAAFAGTVLIIAIVALNNQMVGAEIVIPALAVFAVVQAGPLIWYRRSFGWFHPLVFSALFALASLWRNLPLYTEGLQQNDGLPGYNLDELASLMAASLLLTALAQLAYYAGFCLGPNVPVIKLSFPRPRRVGIKAFVIVIVSTLLLIMYILGRDGLSAYLLLLGQGRSTLIDQGLLSGEWVIITRVSVVACLIWLMLDDRAVRQPLFWISALLSLVSQYLVSLSRSSVIYFFITALLVWTIRARKLDVIKVVLAVAIAMVLVGGLGTFRTSMWSGVVDWDAMVETAPIEAFTRGVDELRYRGNELNPIFPILARVPHEVDLLYGRSYLPLLSLPVPRALWRDKPRSAGTVVGEIFLNTSAGVPPGAIGEAYWNFHVPGVLFVFALFGVFQRWVARSFQRYGATPAAILMYGVTLFLFNSPDVLTAVNWLYTIFLLLALLRLFGALSLERREALLLN